MPCNTRNADHRPQPIDRPAHHDRSRRARSQEPVAQQERDDLALRVYVAGGGCSGLQYGMALDENIEPGDETFDSQRRHAASWTATSLRYLTGSVVDYITTDMGGGFKIENPNAIKSCGCGSSFSAGEDERRRPGHQRRRRLRLLRLPLVTQAQRRAGGACPSRLFVFGACHARRHLTKLLDRRSARVRLGQRQVHSTD